MAENIVSLVAFSRLTQYENWLALLIVSIAREFPTKPESRNGYLVIADVICEV